MSSKSGSFDKDAIIDMDLILSVCAGLVVLDSQNSTVRLVHDTAQELFQRRAPNMLSEADNEISQVSPKYLSSARQQA